MILRYSILILSFLYCSLSGYGQYLDRFGDFKFFKNQGQWDSQVQYAVSSPNGIYIFNKNGFSLITQKIDSTRLKDTPMHPHAHEIPEQEIAEMYLSNFKVNGATNLTWTGLDEGITNYNFLKGEKQNWIQGAHTYDELVSSNFAKGINIRFVGGEGLKYEFQLKPLADPKNISLTFEGGSLSLTENGELLVKSPYQEIRESEPYAYQIIEGKKVVVPCKYRLRGNVISYKLGKYDNTKALIIDPKLIFSTSAGSFADYWGNTACNDQFGSLYTAGTVFPHTGSGRWVYNPISGWVFVRTPSLDGLPTTFGAFQDTFSGGDVDIGVMKFDSAGTTLLYSTYIGGNDADLPISTVVDRTNGDLLILVTTGSTDFPMGNGLGYDTSFNGGTFISDTNLVGGYQVKNGSDIVVLRLDAGGTSIKNATYVGGDGNDGIGYDYRSTTFNYGDELRGDIFIANDGGILVASVTQAPDTANFPGLGFNPTFNGGGSDGVAFKLNSDLSSLLWSNQLGGPGNDVAFSIKEDSLGAVFVGGGSEGGLVNFPVGGYQYVVNNDVDGFVWKIAANGASSVAGTYIGDSLFDQIYFVDLGENDEVFVLGQTETEVTIFPHIDSVYNNPRNGLFLAKFSNDLSSLEVMTCLGDTTSPAAITANISPTAFLVNDCGNIFISGWGGIINSNYRGDFIKNMPVDNSSYKQITDGDDFYLMVLYRDAERLLYSTYFGGGVSREHVDGGTSRFDKSGTVYQSVCSGCGGNQDFPTFPDDGNQNTYPMRNKSGNCNNGVFKFDLANLEAIINGPDCLMKDKEYGFANESIGGRDFYWDFGDGSAPIGTEGIDSAFHTYLSPGFFTIMMVATDLVTCTGKDTVYMTVAVLNHITAGGDTTICARETVPLFVEGAFNPEWSPNLNLSCFRCSNPFATPTDTIYYYVKDSLKAGCSVIDSVLINAKPNPVPGLTIGIGPHRCYPEPVQFTYETNQENCECCIPLEDFLWSFGDGETSIEKNPLHTYPSEGIWNVSLTATSVSDTVITNEQLNLYPIDSCLKNIYIPNAFSPNDDGENDILYVRGINIIELEFRLYNRWGEEVFMTTNLNLGWNAIYKGEKQSQQVFVYKCYATFYDGEKVELEGNVTLME